MKKYNILLIFLLLSTSGCALTGGSRTQYGGNVKLPSHGNYNNPSQVTVQPEVPIPGDQPSELALEDLYKTYYTPYSKLFKAALRAVEGLNLSLQNFNSTTGLIEFKSIQGVTYFIKVSPDKEFNSRASIKLFTADGSRKIGRDFVFNIFETINYHINNIQ